jgi:hypothetical protein
MKNAGKRATAAAALLCLSACLENPGVDWRVAHRHDLASAEYDADGSSVRIRLERRNGETRLYLRNTGQKDLDSLDFLIELCRDPGLYPADDGENLGPSRPALCLDRIYGTHILAARLPAGSEADLGALAGDLPEALDEARILFTLLRDSGYSSRYGSNRYGYYEGTWAVSRPANPPDSGSLRGMILRDGTFYFLLADWGITARLLRASLAGDSLVDAHYEGGWDYHQAEALRDPAAIPPAVLRPGAGSSDSLRLQCRFLGHFVPGHPDSLTLRIALARPVGLEWPKQAAGIDPPVPAGERAP